LNADGVLTGRLMKTGNDYSLSCELIDASNQNLIWGNKYDN
jgi:TolB-like protein